MAGQARAMLVGIGSPFGADQLGWQAITHLQQQDWAGHYPKWEWWVTTFDRPGFVLLDHLSGMDLAILLDALDDEGELPRRLDLDELDSVDALISGHGLGLAETLQLGAQLGMLPRHLLIYGLPMGMVESALEGLAVQIDQDIAPLLSC